MPNSQPNYLTIDPSGEVSAEFPGGVTMFASDNVTPPAERSVVWVKESTGGYVARVAAFEPPGFGSAGTISMEVGDPVGPGEFASYVAQADADLSRTYVSVQGTLTFASAVILGSDQSSAFAAASPDFSVDEQQLCVGACTINTGPPVFGQNTALVNTAAGITKNGVGDVTITLFSAWDQIYAAPHVTRGGGAVAYQIEQLPPNKLRILCFNSTNGANTDSTFYTIILAYKRHPH